MPFAHSGGARIYYEVHGEGPWLVLAHGAGGNHLSWWQQVPAFRESHRCLLLDQRGFGLSGAAADPSLLAADLLAVLDHAGAERATLVGQSMGGWAVAGAAALAPERAEGLLLAGTLGGLHDDGILADLAAHHRGVPGFDPHLALAPAFPAEDPARTFLYDEIAGLSAPPTARFLQELLALRVRPDAIHCPVCFVAGAQDQLFPLDLIRRAHARMPGAELSVVAEAGHSAYFERPAEFNRALAAFLERIRGHRKVGSGDRH